MKTITIDYYTDILCVWAYIAQIRITELEREFAEAITLKPLFFPVFGAVEQKMEQQWGKRGGITAYADHVAGVVHEFDHITIHPDVWRNNIPSSSLPAHLYLQAIKLLEQQKVLDAGTHEKMIWQCRLAFFTQCMNFSDNNNLLALCEESRLPITAIQQQIASGKAFAQLSSDMKNAVEFSVKSSPTMIFNEDRQRLSGNVGYRIIQANIKELLHSPDKQHSWC